MIPFVSSEKMPPPHLSCCQSYFECASVPYVSVSCDCCNKLPQIGWLRTTEVILTVLEARSLKLRCQDGQPPSEASRERILCFFQFLVAPGIPWLVATSLQSLPPFSHALLLFCLSPHLSLLKTFVIGLRAHLVNSWSSHLKIFNLNTPAKIPFQMKSWV